MAAVEVVLPKVDMDMESGVITAWKVADGDAVSEGDIIFEMETSKSSMEVEAPGTGVIRDLAAVTGEQIPVGTTVAWIHPPADDDAAKATPARASAQAPAPVAVQQAVPVVDLDGSRLEPFTPTRRVIADRLSESARTAPHFYLTAQIDMTALQSALRSRSLGTGRAAAKPSLTAAIARITGRVLMNHPRINASIDGDALRLHSAANIGIAMERAGDLVVPVLRHANTRSLIELTQEFARLRAAVDAHAIALADLRGGTFTISNLGMYGVDSFTAIINPPESAILAIGRAADTPVVREGAIVIRAIATFSLSSDHRVVDGVAAARFMAELKAGVEAPDAQL